MGIRAGDRHEAVRALLIRALHEPGSLTAMSSSELDLTIRAARRVRLLGRLAAQLQDSGAISALPDTAKDQLASALVLAESRARVAFWELDRITWALSDRPEISPIAMKGCAYLLLKLPNTRGRFFADVDLMVSESQLDDLEAHLNRYGWRTHQLTPYDDNYYREWAHELPPLVHPEREVEIDLHHNILPRTARLKPSAEKMLATARLVDDSRFRVLCDEDIVLHAMVHLMFTDEMADKLRDLVDIDDMLRHFSGQDAGFWDRLVSRAAELDLCRPTYYGVHFAQQLLACPVPDAVADSVRKWAPPQPIAWLLDRLVPSALFPPHPDHPSRWIGFYRQLLYMRSHWLRMPPFLLIYHLAYKFYVTRIRRVGRAG